MTERRLILHVGPHKTGSTALQYALLNTTAELAAHKFIYPKAGIAQFAHHKLYGVFSGHPHALAELTTEQFRATLPADSHVILSSENFIYLSEQRQADMRDAFADYTIEVIIFIRTPVDLWPSHWQELVKHGRAETLIEYMASYAGWSNTIEAAIMNPVVQANRFGRSFGRDALRLFSYDNLIHSGEDIYDLFWRAILRIDAPPPIRERRTLNPSLDPVMIELLRSLNEQHQIQTGARPSDTVLARYLPHQKRIEASGAYGDFREKFETHAANIYLESTQDLLRNRERMLINNFAPQIENKAAPDRLNHQENFKRKTPYARRYWTDRLGLTPWIDEVLAQIMEE